MFFATPAGSAEVPGRIVSRRGGHYWFCFADAKQGMLYVDGVVQLSGARTENRGNPFITILTDDTVAG